MGFDPVLSVQGSSSGASVLMVCEHASNRIPDWMQGLGLSDEAAQSHAAWDPGALGVAEKLSELLHAPLIAGRISRLVYDLNRPPEAPDAMPEVSEIYDIPGNRNLSQDDRTKRVDGVFRPFRDHLAQEIAARQSLRLLVTVHSFTPVYKGQKRAVELGILHGRDPRFAQAMLDAKPDDFAHKTAINEPYGPQDGVAHTLDLHGTENGLLNVMLEIRNDLITTTDTQTDMAKKLAPWITKTLSQFLEAQDT